MGGRWWWRFALWGDLWELSRVEVIHIHMVYAPWGIAVALAKRSTSVNISCGSIVSRWQDTGEVEQVEQVESRGHNKKALFSHLIKDYCGSIVQSEGV